MNATNQNLVIWSYGAALVAHMAFAFYLRAMKRDWRAGAASGAMFVAVVIGAAWAGTGVAFALAQTPLLFATGMGLDSLRYGCWFAFLFGLIQQDASTRAGTRATRMLKPIAAFIVFAAVGLQVRAMLGYDPLPALAHILALTAVVMALVLLEQLMRNIAADSLWHLKPLALGLVGAFLFDLYIESDTLLFRKIDTDAYVARGFVYACVVPLLWMSTLRTRDWAAKIRLSQRAAFQSASVLLIGIYMLFMAGAGYYVREFGGSWGGALTVTFAFAALLLLAMLIVSRSMRASLRVTLGKHFVSYRYDYREEWLRFTRALSIQETPDSMGQQVVRGLADLVESPAGGLWLKDETAGTYRQASRWNLPQSEAVEEAGSALCRFISESGWVVNLEEYRSFPGRYSYMRLPAWIARVPNAWLIVPLVSGNNLIGFVLLASARTSVDVNWEVNDLLRTAGRQAASYLAQMRATEGLLEAQKFDAFNRMSAFVVHDLKNIVTQLSLLLKNAEKHSANPEFQADMRMTVQHSVERMRPLMLQLREGATPPGTPVGVDLAHIIEKIAQAKVVQGEIGLEIGERLMTRGHEERIERVIGHLVQNALDAIDPTGKVWVRLYRHGGQAMIEVGDTGVGMEAQFVRERLFKPFQTTKRAGMGIGAYESQQYIQELGGKIVVESTVGVGTRITVQLPLFGAAPLDARAARNEHAA